MIDSECSKTFCYHFVNRKKIYDKLQIIKTFIFLYAKDAWLAVKFLVEAKRLLNVLYRQV